MRRLILILILTASFVSAEKVEKFNKSFFLPKGVNLCGLTKINTTQRSVKDRNHTAYLYSKNGYDYSTGTKNTIDVMVSEKKISKNKVKILISVLKTANSELQECSSKYVEEIIEYKVIKESD